MADNDKPIPYTTPLVARMAAEHGVDLSDVQGTGAGGRIRRDDVLRAAGKLPAATESERNVVAALVNAHRADGAAQAQATEDAVLDDLAFMHYTTTNGREPGQWSDPERWR